MSLRRLAPGVLLLLACATRPLALAPELEGTPALRPHFERHPVGGLLSGRAGGTLRLGEDVFAWERAPGSLDAGAPGPGSSCRSEGAFHFVLPPAPARTVQCTERMQGERGIGLARSEAGVKELQLEHAVHCTVPGGALALSDAGEVPGRLRGTASLDGVSLALEPAFPSGSGWEAAWGVTVRDAQGRAVAALQLQGTQALWLAPGLAPATRAAVRLATAALLLKSTGTEGCPPRSR